jgi:hypothetical protein
LEETNPPLVRIESPSKIKMERRQAASKPVALTLRHIERATPAVIALSSFSGKEIVL